ncbi:MAG: gliding motility-associated-like protein, partial [Maribacter sp.]
SDSEFTCNISSITLTTIPAVQGNASYEWSTGVTDNGATGTITISGDYTVTITDDDNGCTSTAMISIGDNFLVPTAIIVSSGTQLYCSITNINLDASTSVSQGALTYEWDDSSPTTMIIVTTAGTYSVTITDINGCTNSTSINITALDPVVITELSTNNSTCNASDDGAISISVSGGDGNYTYDWNGAAVGSTDTANSLSPEIYTVIVTDGLACTATYQYEVTEPLPITPSLIQSNVSCTGGNEGTATATSTGGTAVGGYSFVWSTIPIQNTPMAIGLSAGTYTVTITDDNNCEATAEVMITEPLPLSLVISGTDISCANGDDGTATVVASDGTGAYTYLWSNSPLGQIAAITNLTVGTYTVTVTDDNDCEATATIILIEPIAMIVVANETQIQSDCENPDGVADVSASNGAGGYTFTWGTNPIQTGTTAIGLTAGNYFVTAIDANGCTASTTVEINSTFTITPVATIIDIDCNGSASGSIEIVTTGVGNEPFSYDWGTSTANPFTNLIAGTYTVTITDINNCSRIEPYVVTEPEDLVITVIDVASSTCTSANDGAIEISPTGGPLGGSYSYEWSSLAAGQDNTVTGIPFGVYSVTVTDDNGCQEIETITVNTPSPILITISNTTPANCTACDGIANISVSGGVGNYTYSWDNGNNSATPDNLCAGSSILTVFDGNNCSETVEVIIDNVTTLVINEMIAIDTECPTSCDGEAIVLVSGGLEPYTYLWDTLAGEQTTDTITEMCAGTYGVTVFDQNGCEVTGSTTISSPFPLVLDLSSEDVICYGENNGAIIIEDATGGTAPYSYSIDDEFYIFDTIFPFQTSGDYTIYIEDNNQCRDSVNITVYQPVQLLAFVDPLDTLINLGETVDITVDPNQFSNITITWTPDSSLSCNDCPDPTSSTLETITYTVTVQDTVKGCVFEEDVLVRVNKDRNIYIPNAFTPNGDGNNDFLSVYSDDISVERVKSFRIFDRWGELVFENTDFQTNTLGDGWDGTFKGKKMATGVFVYAVEVVFIDGYEEIFSGDVTLLD